MVNRNRAERAVRGATRSVVAYHRDLLVKSPSIREIGAICTVENPATNESRAASADAIDRALRAGAGVLAISGRKILRVVGDDRVSFLHGMSSGNFKDAAAGSILPALFLTEHAHLLADFFAWIDVAGIFLDIDSTQWEAARAHLERLIVADDVEFEDMSDTVLIDIEGPRAAEAVRAALGGEAAPLTEWRFMRRGEFLIGNLPRYGSSAYSIIAPANAAARVVAQVAGLGGDFQAVQPDALDVIRIENGIAITGVDTGDKTIALEARLARAIAPRKGCYVGQETIERVTARGGLRKRLFGLRIEGGRVPERGAAVMLSGKEVGRLTSAACSAKFGVIGLAILHHSACQEGTALLIADAIGEIGAKVSELPFH